MSDRRRLLMAIANQFKWLPYYYEYLYNDLVPTTIDSKNVKDKAKVATIYGNSVVENQLFNDYSLKNAIQNGGTVITTDSYSFTNNINTFTFTMKDGAYYVRASKDQAILGNHYYLCSYEITSNKIIRTRVNAGLSSQIVTPTYTSISANTKTTIHNIFARSTNDSANSLWFSFDNLIVDESYTISIELKSLIDLTKMFPFDTPTTLTDNRVQAILNRDYIPYNTGEIKSVDIGEIESEPYNLFDGELEFGLISNGNAVGSSTNGLRTKEYISVIGGKSYTWENDSSISFNGFYVSEYNEEKTFIKETRLFASPNNSITLTNNTCFIKFHYFSSTEYDSVPTNPQICFHRTGTRTGYAPHVAPSTLQLKYQGSGVGTAHDTMEIGKENVVFTKRMGTVDLGSLAWSTSGSTGNASSVGVANSAKPPLTNNDLANIISSFGRTETYSASWGAEKIVSLNANGTLYVKLPNNPNESAENVKTLVTGYPLQYQLATPQVITIPRKHLGCCRISDLTFTKDTANNVFIASISNGKGANSGSDLGNLYCVNLFTITYNNAKANNVGISSVYISSSQPCRVAIHTPNFATDTATDLLNEYGGETLFYETQDEVADMLDTIDVEAGGTLTSNWFSWNENNYASITRASTTMAGLTYTNNGDNTFDLSGTATRYDSYYVNDTTNIPTGHHFLLKGFSGSSQTTVYMSYDNKHDYNGKGIIGTRSENDNRIILYIKNGAVVNLQNCKVMLIDLTLGFGAGKEPTSLSDPRIQYIMNQGYIPTNATGTNVSIDPNVLPNATFNMKCK